MAAANEEEKSGLTKSLETEVSRRAHQNATDGVDRKVQDTIGELLRRHFDELGEQPMPDAMKRLWEKLSSGNSGR